MSGRSLAGKLFDEYESPVDDKERAAFEKITNDYHLISKIGEGTFSTVYKAEDCLQHLHDAPWIALRGGDTKASYYVAIKRIYVTSSPQRIYNELDILNTLSGCESILPLITAFRHEDQVFVILPYFKHPDFRSYYRELPLRDIRYYMRSLFLALDSVHAVDVIHRDVKPTNFLYDVAGRKGELVDFGLAERQQQFGQCPCNRRSGRTFEQMSGMVNPTHVRLRGVYLKDDQRPGKRANRAGTRGFRAPEVLFKCDSQFSAVDIWSAGVILLTFLSTRFPFFNSNDDIEALTEIASIFGKAQIRTVAAQHNCSFETSISTLHEKSISFTRLIHWCTDSERKSDDSTDSREQEMAISFLEKCMTLDPWNRWSASEALEDEFLNGIEADERRDTESQNVVDHAEEIDHVQEALKSAADIDSPNLNKENDATEQDIYHDSTSDTQTRRPDNTTRPREFVFLKTDDMPDERLHDQMRQQLINNVNNMRARREATLKRHGSENHSARPAFKMRSNSAVAITTNALSERPTSPSNQILPCSAAGGSTISHSRAKTLSPSHTSQMEFSTIDPRLIEHRVTKKQNTLDPYRENTHLQSA